MAVFRRQWAAHAAEHLSNIDSSVSTLQCCLSCRGSCKGLALVHRGFVSPTTSGHCSPWRVRNLSALSSGSPLPEVLPSLLRSPIPQGALGGNGSEDRVWESEQRRSNSCTPELTGCRLAQAFRFLDMDDISRERFRAAAERMERAGFSDAEEEPRPFDLAYQSVSKLQESIRLLSVAITSGRGTGTKK